MAATITESGKCQLCEELGDRGYYMRCGHFHCTDCLGIMIRLSSEIKVQCSVTNCEGYLDDEEIHSLASPEIFQAFIERIFNHKRENDSATGDDGPERKHRRSGTLPVVPNYAVPVPAEFREEIPNEEEPDMASGFGQLTATATFLLAAGYSHEEALQYLETQSVLLTIKPISCSICMDDDVQPGDGIIIKNCLHMLCRNCLVNYIGLSEVAEVECPCTEGESKCHEVLLPLEIRELCSLDTYEKIYVDRSLKVAQESEGMCHCMTPNCAYFCQLDQEFCYQCPFCHQENCYRCQLQHTGLTCEEYNKKIKEEQEARDASDLDARNKLIQKQNERLNQATIEREKAAGFFRPCPNCGVLIEKNLGCDHMRCTRCGTSYNWSDVSPERLSNATL